jgi:hypothetical protein
MYTRQGEETMPSDTVRIKPESHAKLKELARRSGESMPETLDRAIDALYRQRFLEEVNSGYAALRADPKAWAAELAERQLLAGSLADGLEDD